MTAVDSTAVLYQSALDSDHILILIGITYTVDIMVIREVQPLQYVRS